jgi:2-oxoglutarate ferredoxin oxidoreductase subunit alpha
VSRKLIDGSEAIAEAAIAAGLKFYAGYPMAPSTDLLEHMADKLPGAGGVCINADTEIEGVNMALGASQVGFRAATGSTGQGVSLMQEAIAEAALNETPLVVFTVARSQQDYKQCTRGGGWGDYRTITLAPKNISEAVTHTQMLFHLADKYRVPCILLVDNILARTQASVEIKPLDLPPLPPKDWALDGTLGGTGRSRQIWTWGIGKHNNLTEGGVNAHWQRIAAKFDAIAKTEALHEESFVDDADVVVCSFGTGALFVEHVVREMRQDGHRIGYFRPVTLWPFPGEALAKATRTARVVAVFEINAGQLVEDVMIHVHDRNTVRQIGGVSSDTSGLNIGSLMDAPVIRKRIESLMQGNAA